MTFENRLFILHPFPRIAVILRPQVLGCNADIVDPFPWKRIVICQIKIQCLLKNPSQKKIKMLPYILRQYVKLVAIFLEA